MHYIVAIDDNEAKSLAWVAARYDSASILWAHCEPVDDDNDIAMGIHSGPNNVITLPESEAWRYLDSLAEENGNPNQILPTCVGGTLADKLTDLWESIV